MKYTNEVWNGNYLNYDLILPNNRKWRKLVHFITLPFIIGYILLCAGLLTQTITTDGYRLIKYTIVNYGRKKRF